MASQLEAYDVPGASDSLTQFMDLLTNWYIRTQRDRFWDEDAAAFDTLWTVLTTVTRLAAPCCRWRPRRSIGASPASARCT
ncbi:hypothetical protein GCM10025876_31860 [Demequina litorisediminis]|uniref:Methionyl/Valyl/Leucyl/Isoleucyl-tRNA synthetase anticodon-binding domain-containing protein n=1 Tax=Demequina litorisediminis TaxID=1849022 RepID=A0ABQ6IJT7_9MICO|nr:hypothetical protein GCM10025876_31860 [Demequina litorisediminis]